MSEICQQIIDAKAIAILRGDHQQHLDVIARLLQEGGIRAIEVTLNSPGALAMIAHLAQAYGDQMLVGAGTVLDTDGVAAAAAAGARFIVAPDTFAEVIAAALQGGLEPLPGVFTATEARTAIRAGARLLKLFPAEQGGPEYLRQLRAPLHDAQFVPTGGISAENAGAYLKAGAVALGIGGWLVPAVFDASASACAGLSERAANLMRAVREA